MTYVSSKSGSLNFLFYLSWKVNNAVLSSADVNYLENKKARTNGSPGEKFDNYVTEMRHGTGVNFTSGIVSLGVWVFT